MSIVQTIVSKYGVPGIPYQNKYCELWEIQKDFPWFANVMVPLPDGKFTSVKHFTVNKDFKAKLIVAFKLMEANGSNKEIKTFDGCYNDRSVRGMNSTSLHAWAMAVDLNASAEKLGQIKTNWSSNFLNSMKSAGIYWGGSWIHRKDPMHFGLFNG